MDDLISRKALMDDMKYMFKDDDIPISPMNAKLLVEEAPAVEAEPVRHGRWIRKPNGEVRCSECNSLIAVVFAYDTYKEEAQENPFCYHCGTKMDLTEKEEQIWRLER